MNESEREGGIFMVEGLPPSKYAIYCGKVLEAIGLPGETTIDSVIQSRFGVKIKTHGWYMEIRRKDKTETVAVVYDKDAQECPTY